MTPRSTDSFVRNEAADWFERVHRRDVDTATLESWQRWMASSRRHRDEFRALEDLWHAAGDVAAELHWPTAQELVQDRDDPEAPSSDPAGTRTKAPAMPMDRKRKSPPRAWRLAAGIAATAIGISAAWLSWNALRHPNHAVVRTQAREHREITLPDGSRVLVGARTRVTFDYTASTRNIAIDSGEAFFEVTHDVNRPFIVRAGVGTITAVGTAFNVKHVEGRIAVAVVSGIVDVRSVASAAGAPPERITESVAHDEVRAEPRRMLARVKAGEAVVYGPDLAQVRVTTTRAALSWQHGRLEYLDDALKYIVPDVSRYTRKRIVIVDPQVAEMRFTGTVFEGGVDLWLESLPEVFPVEVVWAGSDTVLLRARATH